MKSDNGLVLETSLQGFFFSKLNELNQKTSTPLPGETIYYSSLVMDRLSVSSNYFEIVEGKVREKCLGIKLMEATRLGSRKKMIEELRDTGDTALILCGYFADSLNAKILDIRYYQDIGQAAYKRLNGLVPSLYEIPSFYQELSRSFELLSSLMRIFQRECSDEFDFPVHYIIGKAS